LDEQSSCVVALFEEDSIPDGAFVIRTIITFPAVFENDSLNDIAVKLPIGTVWSSSMAHMDIVIGYISPIRYVKCFS
jgi:hypothetical protein